MNKKRFFTLILLFLLSVLCISAVQLEGFGVADDQESAKTLALQDLASRIELRIVAATTATQDYVKNDAHESYNVNISTDVVTTVDVPIYGAEFVTTPRNQRGDYQVKVTLNSETAIPMYESKMHEMQEALNFIQNRLESMDDKVLKEELLKQLLAGIQVYKKYRNVLMVLNYSPLPDFPVDSMEIAAKAQLRYLQNILNTIQKAAAYIVKNIDQPKIYVYPPAAPGSSEITDFAASLQGALKAELQTVASPDLAEAVFKGSYRVSDEGMDIEYSLISLKGAYSGLVLHSSSARLHPAAYAGMNWQPSGSSIDALIQKGFVVSSDFTVDATTNIGKRELLFHDGDRVELLAKMNAPGYFFILSHIDNDDVRFSYLLDLNGASGNRRFVFYVGPDDVNKWISLGEFQAGAPFGVERLQFMASSTDPVDSLPATYYQDGYFVVGSKSDEAIIQTRGLQRVQTDVQDKKTAEAALTLTVLP